MFQNIWVFFFVKTLSKEYDSNLFLLLMYFTSCQGLRFGEFPKNLWLYYVLFSRAPTRIFSQRMAFLDFKISPFLYRIGCGCLLNAGLHHKQQRVVRGYKSENNVLILVLFRCHSVQIFNLLPYISNYNLDGLSSVGMLFMSFLRSERRDPRLGGWFSRLPLLVGGPHHPSVERNIPMSQILQIFSTIQTSQTISEQTHNCNTEAFP